VSLQISRGFYRRGKRNHAPTERGGYKKIPCALLKYRSSYGGSQFIFRAEAEDRNAGKTLSAFFEAEWDYALEQIQRWLHRSAIGAGTIAGRTAASTRSESRGARDRRAGASDENGSRAFRPRNQLTTTCLRRARDGYRGRKVPRLPDADQSARRRANSGMSWADRLRFETVKITRLGRAAALIPALMDRTSAHAGRRARQVMWPRSYWKRVPAQIASSSFRTGGEPVFQAPQEIPGCNSKCGSRTSRASSEGSDHGRQVLPRSEAEEIFRGRISAAAFDQVGVWQIAQGGRVLHLSGAPHTTTNLTPQSNPRERF